MHEFSIATQIVESVLDFARERQAGEVLRVRLQIGDLTCIQTEQLTFCFNSITRETPMAKTLLEIEPVAARVRCPHCSYQGRPRYWKDALVAATIPTLQCPQCGKAAEATRGHECEIKSVQFVGRNPEEMAA